MKLCIVLLRQHFFWNGSWDLPGTANVSIDQPSQSAQFVLEASWTALGC